jgi:anti-sigma B factor antagonist
MNFEARRAHDVDVLALEGRFDANEVSVVNAWFNDNPQARHVLVNLSGVAFIDSSGLATLVRGLKRCRQNGGELFLCGLQQPVQLIFDLTRLSQAFTIFGDETSALQQLTQQR